MALNYNTDFTIKTPSFSTRDNTPLSYDSDFVIWNTSTSVTFLSKIYQNGSWQMVPSKIYQNGSWQIVHSKLYNNTWQG